VFRSESEFLRGALTADQLRAVFLRPGLTRPSAPRHRRERHDGKLGVILMSGHKAIETIVAENRDPRLHLVYLYRPFRFPAFLLLTESVMQRTREAQAKLV